MIHFNKVNTMMLSFKDSVKPLKYIQYPKTPNLNPNDA